MTLIFNADQSVADRQFHFLHKAYLKIKLKRHYPKNNPKIRPSKNFSGLDWDRNEAYTLNCFLKGAVVRSRLNNTVLSQKMKTIFKSWYLLVLLLTALIVNENLVQWALAVRVGGYRVAAGFEDAFEYFTPFGYLFFTAFRLVPYVGLGTILVILSKTKLNDYVLPVFAGGLIGILAMILWGSWMAQRPYYTDEHVSSTTAIAFLFIPLYAIPTGAVGAVLLALLYTPFRLLFKRK